MIYKQYRSLLIFLIITLLVGPLWTTAAQDGTPETDAPIRIWVDWSLPLDFEAMLQPLVDTDDYEIELNRVNADLAVTVTNGSGAITSRWVYVPVLPFASLAENVSYLDIQRYWNGDNAALSGLSPDGEPVKLIVTRNTLEAMKSFMGEPAEETAFQIVPEGALVTQLWEQRPHAWSLVAFNDLRPALKALSLDHQSVFSDDLDLENYPFILDVGIEGENWAVGQAIDDLLAAGTWQGINRDPRRMSRIVLSGVTALTRATAYYMENNGITSPGDGILPFVEDADVFHTSNEVPFSVQCPYPDPYSGTIFCADDRYLELLTHIGLDVVELTGNHINDYGPGALKHTLDLYDAAGIEYFGGGRTPEEARAALILEHNDNQIAFIGCNMPGPFKAWVSDERPGAAQCDDTYLEQELTRLSETVDVVIMTVQDYEYYRYDPPNAQVTRFTNYANWGADVVIGSQAHQPQGFGFVSREDQPQAFLHHGLGNLFFDQMAQIGTRQMFLDRLIVYDGQVIAVELFTGLIEDYCCPRPMTEAERAEFLNTIFAASEW
ncbi:MAG: CapA family protein [Chloroflexi bacterium]|nr:CapA family protein [Chloroflexota bacterium]